MENNEENSQKKESNIWMGIALVVGFVIIFVCGVAAGFFANSGNHAQSFSDGFMCKAIKDVGKTQIIPEYLVTADCKAAYGAYEKSGGDKELINQLLNIKPTE